MFSMLPDLTPRDSHSLWYTSRRNPLPPFYTALDSSHTLSDGTTHHPTTTGGPNPTNTTPNPTQNTPAPPTQQTTTGAGGNGGGPNSRQNSAHSASTIIERSALGRLQADEALLARRRTAVCNLGSTWLKPIGVTKTLFQMREERREAEEVAEALRREMLVQELADAEAEAAAAAVGGEEGEGVAGGGEDEDMMMMGEGEGEEGGGERDLDADIPDEDAGMGFGYDGISDDDEEEEEEEEEDEEDDEEEEEEEEEDLSEDEVERRQEIARIQAREERMREIREQNDAQLRRSDDVFDFDEEPSEEERSQMLDEEDLIRGGNVNVAMGSQVQPPAGGMSGLDMDMEADLDGEIPEADAGGYEHTDSEAELDSEGDLHDLSYARSAHVIHGRRSSPRRRSAAPRSSLDISGLLDGSSMIGSSPQMRRSHY
ncbi:Apc15p protein-domain-containing protein [Chaetomium sp. MPI-SDFR-AT-0129]|nr:Apc15p protein-domain-containing protein [Chaetomium sp. MPI-SDFR-AT-0129]